MCVRMFCREWGINYALLCGAVGRGLVPAVGKAGPARRGNAAAKLHSGKVSVSCTLLIVVIILLCFSVVLLCFVFVQQSLSVVIKLFCRNVMEAYREKAMLLFSTLLDDVRRNAVYSIFMFDPAPRPT